ncbi:MAG: HlyD family efflux transporter periplasmic adaptor subunit [Planctomycetaceae bacterium]
MNSTASKSHASRGRKIWFVLLTILIGVVTAFTYFKSRAAAFSATAINILQPQERTHVYALGRLEPVGTILQLMPKSGNEGATVEQLLVKEGDEIEAGETLAVLDNQARRAAALKESQALLEAAKARLLQIKAGVKAGDIEAQQAAVSLAEEQSKVANRELLRVRELQKRNATTIEMIDQKQWEYDRLQLEKRRASAQLASLREIRDVDILVAEKEVIAAEAAVAKADADADASQLRSPVAGRVLRIHTHPGERVSDAGILDLGNVRQMQAVAEVFEADVSILEVGLVAEIKLDASTEVLTGRIAEIGHIVARKIVLTNDPVSDTDARVVEVRVNLDAAHLERVARLSNARVEISFCLQPSDARPSLNSSNMDVTSKTPHIR